MRAILILLALASAGFAQASASSPPTEAELLRKQLNEALDELALARAQRGDCEMTLAPIEAQARRADSDRRWAEAKAALERARPGFECNPRTNACVKKPDPPRTPDMKDESL